MKKLFITLFIIAALVLSVSTMAFAQNSNITIFVDGNKLILDTQPTIQDGTTLVPMRAIFEALGATVNWNQATQTAIGSKGNSTVELSLDSYYGIVNGDYVSLAVPAKSINGRILVPLRFISESFNCNVNWNSSTKIITITAGQAPSPLVTVDQLPMDISIQDPDSIGTIYMKATYTNNSQYPIKGFNVTVLLKETNEKTYLSCYDTVMPGETSPVFDAFGPPSQNLSDTEILNYTITVVGNDGKDKYIDYDVKLNKYEWY